MGNRTRKPKVFHVKYVADFLVTATSTKEAFDIADEKITEMVEGDEFELDDIFKVSIESDKFHMVEEVPEDEDEEDEDFDDEDEEDDEDEGEDEGEEADNS